MKTENEIQGGDQTEEKILVSRHLAPLVHAQNSGLPNEKMTTIVVPKRFIITLSDGSRQRIDFPVGTYDIPARLAKHGYLAANGAQVARVAEAAPKPKLEEPIDRDLLTEDNMKSWKFDQLKTAFLQIGGDADALKGNTSKTDLIGMILAKLKTDGDAA
jgi:hypothetical protein